MIQGLGAILPPELVDEAAEGMTSDRGPSARLRRGLRGDGRPPPIPPRHAPGVCPMSRTKSGADAPEVATAGRERPRRRNLGGAPPPCRGAVRRGAGGAGEGPTPKPRPPRWKLSPWAVSTYLLGGTLDDGFAITPKYIGNRRLMEIAVATLATDRALLAPGRAGHGQELGLGAPRGGDRGRLDDARAGDGRHERGGDPLRLELRPPARRRADARRRSSPAR